MEKPEKPSLFRRFSDVGRKKMLFPIDLKLWYNLTEIQIFNKFINTNGHDIAHITYNIILVHQTM